MPVYEINITPTEHTEGTAEDFLALLGSVAIIPVDLYFFHEPWSALTFRCVLPTTRAAILLEADRRKFAVEQREEADDETAYGDFWPEVQHLFQAVSILAMRLYASGERPEILTIPKLVHVAMNTLGLSTDEEIALLEEWLPIKRMIAEDLKAGKIGRGYKLNVAPYKRRGKLRM